MSWLYRDMLRPLAFLMGPETAHGAIHTACRVVGGSPLVRTIAARSLMVEDARLQSVVADIVFPNPVGLAAGFDKAGDMAGLLSRTGFGFLELGTATARAWEGNPRPRVFRLKADGAIVNRMGLNNPGADAVAQNARGADVLAPIGISIAKTPDPGIMGEAGIADFVAGVEAAYDACDYLALNISCPNTAEGKTFEDPVLLGELLAAVRQAEGRREVADTPIFVKVSPDVHFGTLDAIIELCFRHLVAGLIVGNTTTSRDGLRTGKGEVARIGRGGLSGPPLRERALRLVKRAYQTTEGAMPIIGCGGIASAEDAYRFLRAGASLVQLYTAMIYEGPWLMRDINRGLLELMEMDGAATLADVVGADRGI